MDYAEKIRILVADDHEIMRDGLDILIRKQPYMEVVGHAATGEEAIRSTQQLLPDVVLMDYGMPVIDGIEASKVILDNYPQVKIMLLSATLPRCCIDKAICCGIKGIMLKDSTFEELSTAIRAVYSNETYFCSKIMSTIASSYANNSNTSLVIDSWVLKDREQEILRHISNGMSSKEIARQINISPKTVDACRRQIMDKLRIDSIAGLVKFAIREGIAAL